MVRNWIGYPTILAVTLYIGILNQQLWMVALFFAELILFIIQVAALFYQKQNLVVTLTMPERVLSENECAVMNIFFRNIGRLPVQRIKILVKYQCTVGSGTKGKNKKQICVWGNVDSEDTQSYGVQTGPFLGGQFLLNVPYIRIYDYFGIFSLKIKIKEKQSITVIPDFEVMPLAPIRTQAFFDGESDDIGKGQDPTELYDIREYQAGDNLRQIYWKRSAGRETILYRESAAQKGANVVFFLQRPSTQKEIWLHYQIKIAGSLMHSLLEEGYRHFFVWEGTEALDLKRVLIQSDQDIYEALSELLEDESILKNKEQRKKRQKRQKKENQKERKNRKENLQKKKYVKKKEYLQKKGNRQKEGISWEEQIRVQYQVQFAGMEHLESFFLLSYQSDKKHSSALILKQEDEVLSEFLKGKRKLTGTVEEMKLLNKEMREL